MAARAALVRAWTRRGWLARLLWPASMLYGLLSMARRGLYQLQVFHTHRVRVPVVVVGNVVAGGSGKTPAVIAIVNHLSARGLHPGVISRGYGRSTQDCREAGPRTAASEAGDEPVLIARATGVPVFVARERVDAARVLLAAYPQVDVLVCDDGLQHYALRRDVEICVFDDRGVGNGFLLPAGPLREAWPRDADLVLHSGERPAFAGYTATRQLEREAVRANGTRKALSSFIGQPVTAVAAIAKPEAFFAMLRAAGLELAHTVALPDHDDFAGWTAPTPAAAGAALPLLCTEKDAVKLWRDDPQAWAVPLRFTPEPAFLAALDALLDRRLSSPNAATREATDGHQTA